MKKISYKLKVAVIGKDESVEKLFLSYFEKLAIKKSISSDKIHTYLLIHNSIPIKVYLVFHKSLEDLLYDEASNEGFDVLMLTLNVFNRQSLKNYQKKTYRDFCSSTDFRGSSILVAINNESIKNKNSNESARISRYKLIRKCIDMNLVYCFELIEIEQDLFDMYNNLLSETTLKFKLTKPELYQQAIEYGKLLSNQL